MIDAVVLCGSRWDQLEHLGGRWKYVIREWLRSPRVGRVTVVDYPSYKPWRALTGGTLVEHTPSSLEDVACLRVELPLGRVRTPLDEIGWRRAASALRTALPDPVGPRVALAATPLWTPVLGRLGVDVTAFDAVDDWRANPALGRVRGRVHHGYAAARSAHVVTAVSPVLTRTLSHDYGLAAVTVPNGVDVPRFAVPGAVPAGLPSGPFAAYVGHIESRVDVELLAQVSQRLPELPIVMGGTVTEPERARLAQVPGVHLLGPIPHDEVPGLLNRAVVGLLPHRRSAFTDSMDPLKLLEYLAAGLPVVSTLLPGLDRYGPHVRVAETAEAFATAVRLAANEGRDPERASMVADRDWPSVADRMLDLFTASLVRS